MPRAQLDVRGSARLGSARFDGNIKFSQPTDTFGTGALRDETKFFGYYEEGTWTPIIYGSTSGEKTATTSNGGWYVRIGNAVTIGGTISWNGGTTISGQVRLKTLPYVSRTGGNRRMAISVGVCSDGSITTGDDYTTIRMVIDPGTNYMYIMESVETGSTNYSHNPEIASSGNIYGFGGTYLT